MGVIECFSTVEGAGGRKRLDINWNAQREWFRQAAGAVFGAGRRNAEGGAAGVQTDNERSLADESNVGTHWG